MDTRKAIKIAVAAMQEEIKLLNVDANMLDKLGFRSPTTVKASRRRAELKEAIEALERQIFGGAQARPVKATRAQ